MSTSRSSGSKASHAAFPGLQSSGTSLAVTGPHSKAFEIDTRDEPLTNTCKSPSRCERGRLSSEGGRGKQQTATASKAPG